MNNNADAIITRPYSQKNMDFAHGQAIAEDAVRALTTVDATETHICELIALRIEVIIGRLYKADPHLTHIETYSVLLAERPTTPKQRREHAISRILYTWLRKEEENPKAVAKDIETLAVLGRSEKWKTAIRTWAHIARTDPPMFMQYATYTNYQV